MGKRTALLTSLTMQKTVVINIVGLSSALIGEHTPFLKAYSAKRHLKTINPVLPAVTTAVQSTYLTGKWPSEHGIVGNGWYDREDCEIKFWKQSNKLVQAESIWDKGKRANANFTCSQFFWWYNMYSTADFAATPRPNYLADGRKIPDFYSHPAELRDYLRDQLGPFPLFHFWGPGADIKSSQWIADAAILTDQQKDPTLSLIYLPHLDYCQQKFGPDVSKIKKELNEIDQLASDLVHYYEQKNAKIIILSEYGIAPVNNPIHINRVLREAGLLQIRVERGLELLDAGASKAFAVADHQIAHIYINDPSVTEQVEQLLRKLPGVDLVLNRAEQKEHHIDHERSGEFVIMSNKDSWFTYYFWLDDKVAPDYARVVDIHKKPGYDPVEMFMSSKIRAAYKLLRKKLGFRYVLDVIPLDANLVKGSHGSVGVGPEYHPVLITDEEQGSKTIAATDVHDIIWTSLFPKN